MEREERSDRFTALEGRFAGYEVYDPQGEKIGKVDDLFVDENDQPEYVGVKTGFFGLRSTLIPWEMARVDEGRGVIEVLDTKEHVKDAPNFDDEEEITPEYEERVYSHFGLQRVGTAGERGPYGAYYDAEGAHPGEATEVLSEPQEIKVQRAEEELRAGTREREAGSVNVRKRVRTDREQLRVPKRREEVHVERVPVEGREASEAEIGEGEVRMPVTEEEVVVEKRPVAREEVRLRKDVAHEEEVVEEDVRREEVEIDDATERRL